MKNRKRRRTVMIITGLLLFLSALALTLYNYMLTRQAADASEAILTVIQEETEPDEEEGLGTEQSMIPLYQLYADYPMKVEMIDGYGYIGTLEIPSLSLSLPVMSEWSYPGLRIAPGRYAGSIYSQDMVIAAHNYETHFGKLKTLSPGDTVIFTDMEQNVFTYEISYIEQLEPTQVDELITGDWDLTLFTCTIGGQTRVTVRCELVEPRWVVQDS